MEKRCIPFKELKSIIGGISRATVDRWNFDPEYAKVGFPPRVTLGTCRVCWWLHEILAWLERQPRAVK
jgi:predicted DNA-binding transcriptional regulator AlpA